jgi:hypothetical protein
MLSKGAKLGWLAGAICTAALSLSPAIGASDHGFPGRNLFRMTASSVSVGTFTPASADPRLAALMARNGLNGGGFRFTPSAAVGKGRAVTVAVRARTIGGPAAMVASLATGAAPTIGIAPVSYDLGAGVGWKRFALTGDVHRFDAGALPGSRVSADLGVSYNTSKWSTRVQLAAERPVGNAPRTLAGTESLAVDVGGSFRLTHNLDVTAGVRYKTERERLDRIQDNRRDSQAVYVGTAFRF